MSLLVRRRLALLPLLACLACSVLGIESEENRLNDQYKKWQSQRLQNYGYVYERFCFCPPDLVKPVRIQVRQGAITSVVMADSGVPVEGARWMFFQTVDAVFESLIQFAKTERSTISVQYDPVLGYPTNAAGDIDRAADAGFRIRISGLHALD